ncbi:MAG: chorismate mutase [Treponema sp.]|nr:chorismate mutase [Treponema sp.]
MEGNVDKEKRLYALRGAVRCRNEEGDLREQVTALYDELLGKNGLEEEDLVSIIFSVTGDLDARNPASALRQGGRASSAALFVTQEARFPGSPERIIRVLIHCYMEAGAEPVHVYRNGAEVLRPDRAAAPGPA